MTDQKPPVPPKPPGTAGAGAAEPTKHAPPPPATGLAARLKTLKANKPADAAPPAPPIPAAPVPAPAAPPQPLQLIPVVSDAPPTAVPEPEQLIPVLSSKPPRVSEVMPPVDPEAPALPIMSAPPPATEESFDANVEEGQDLEALDPSIADGETIEFGALRVTPIKTDEGTRIEIRATDDVSAALLQRLLSIQPRLGNVPRVLRLSWDPARNCAFAMQDTLGSVSQLSALQWHLKRRLELFVKVAESVHAAHGAGIWYGPFPPDLVLFDTEFQPVLLGPTLTPLVPAYSAPENREKPKPSTASDVFSLGRFLHFVMLLDTPPDATDPLPRLEDLVRLPSGLVRIVRKATSADVNQRYADVAAMLADVMNYANYAEVGLAHPNVEEINRGITSFVPAKQAPVVTAPVTPQKAKAAAEIAKKGADLKKKKGKAGPSKLAQALVFTARQCKISIASGAILLTLVVAASFVLALPNWFGVFFSAGCAAIALGVIKPGADKEAKLRFWLATLAFTSTLALGAVPALNSFTNTLRLSSGSPEARSKAIREAMGQGKRDFTGRDLSGITLDGIAAWAMVFAEANLEGASLKKCDLRGADFTKARFAGANITGTKLEGAKLVGVIGLEQAICDATTSFPVAWKCSDGKPEQTGE
jgi:hypothetical protein